MADESREPWDPLNDYAGRVRAQQQMREGNVASLKDEFGPAPGFDGNQVVDTSDDGTVVRTADGRIWADHDGDGVIDIELIYNAYSDTLWGDTDNNGSGDWLFGN